MMEICYKCGVKVVTVYAFSIENFNRPKYEVEGLMQMAKVKLEQLTTYGHVLDRYGACIRVLGQRELIREDVLEVVDKAVARSSHNNKLVPPNYSCYDTGDVNECRAVLNICFPYTSRAEMATAIKATVQEFLTPPPPKNQLFSPSRIRQKILSRQLDNVLPIIPDDPPDELTEPDAAESEKDVEGDGEDYSSSTTLPPDSPPLRLRGRNGSHDVSILANPETITVETLEKHMYTANVPPLDLFVRTSGVQRLSDFMLWQCHQNTQIFFLSCLWPEFDLHHFVWVLLEWQWRLKKRERDEAPTRIRDSKPHRVVD